jgi:hypothetical protein
MRADQIPVTAWPALQRAKATLERLEAEQREAGQVREAARAEVRQAGRADEQAAADAYRAGKPAPKTLTEPKARERLAAAELQYVALRRAVADQIAAVEALVDQRREKWTAELDALAEEARTQAVAALEQTRTAFDTVGELAGLRRFLADPSRPAKPGHGAAARLSGLIKRNGDNYTAGEALDELAQVLDPAPVSPPARGPGWSEPRAVVTR